jgi:hypothetical protein
MTTELAKRSLKRATTEHNEALETLLFEGTHEALRMRIAIRGTWPNRDDVGSVFLQDFSKLSCIFRISVDDEVRVASEKAVVERREVECDFS